MKILNEKTLSLIIKETKPDKSGYLLKKGSEYKKTFKRRFFILIGNLLVYYVRNPYPNFDLEPYGIIILEGHFIEVINNEKQDYVFQISFNSSNYKHLKVYILAAESEGDLKDWFQSLLTAGSEYFRLKQHEISSEIRAIKEVLGYQFDKERIVELSRQYNSNNVLLNEFIDNPYTKLLLSMNFEDMHDSARKHFQNIR